MKYGWIACGASPRRSPRRPIHARLVLYEDGLHTYLSREDYHFRFARLLQGTPPGLPGREAANPGADGPSDLSITAMLPRHLARVAASYLWISLMVPPADYQRRLPRVQLQTPFLKETSPSCSDPR